MLARVRNEETDLTYEGIETRSMRRISRRDVSEETDLTYEGIETLISSDICIFIGGQKKPT